MSDETKSALEEFTDTELQEELARRQKEASMPKPIEFPNFDPLKKMCVETIEDIAKDVRVKDHVHYIFECAMECVYGKNIFSWYNENYHGE